MLSLVPPWRVESERDITTTRVFTLREKRTVSPLSGKGGDFVYLHAPDWANVIALTSDNNVVMIEQFRHGTGEVTLELPGGIVDAGEDPSTGVVRELREETGYAGTWRGMIGVCSANPAILSNRVHTGLVTDARVMHDVHLDGTEEIGVRLVPMRDIRGLIRQGVIHHSLIIAAFHYFDLFEK